MRKKSGFSGGESQPADRAFQVQPAAVGKKPGLFVFEDQRIALHAQQTGVFKQRNDVAQRARVLLVGVEFGAQLVVAGGAGQGVEAAQCHPGAGHAVDQAGSQVAQVAADLGLLLGSDAVAMRLEHFMHLEPGPQRLAGRLFADDQHLAGFHVDVEHRLARRPEHLLRGNRHEFGAAGDV